MAEKEFAGIQAGTDRLAPAGKGLTGAACQLGQAMADWHSGPSSASSFSNSNRNQLI
jgi:hypothetical protein